MSDKMWTHVKLSDIGSIIGGATPSTSKELYYGGDIPWLTPKDLSNFHGRYIDRGERNITQEGLNSCSAQLLPAGSVLFSSRAPIGYIAIAKNPIATNQGFKSIIPNPDKVDNLFLYYLLKYNKKNIEAMGSGTTFKEVSGATMKNIEVMIPPLAEQKRIAAILGALDDKIELNRRINANLEEQAKALYKSWFVDFEPFKDAGFVDSELGPMPKGWSVGNVNDIVQILSGFAFKSETFAQIGSYQLITIKGVQDGYLDINGASYISKVPLKMPAYCNLGIGDILLSLTGNIGRVCIVDRPNLLLNQRVAKLKLQNSNQDSLFVYILFRQDAFKNHLLQIARGTAQLNLSPVEASKMKIILPPANILLKFSQIGQYLFDEIVHNHQETLHLSTLRDTLLPRLMTGEIPVMDNVINEL